MSLRPLLLVLLLIALTGAGVAERADAAAAPTACAVSAPTSTDDAAPGIDDSGLVGAETAPEAPFGVEAHDAASVLRAGADALRHAPASAPPADGHGAPSSPPPER